VAVSNASIEFEFESALQALSLVDIGAVIALNESNRRYSFVHSCQRLLSISQDRRIHPISGDQPSGIHSTRFIVKALAAAIKAQVFSHTSFDTTQRLPTQS
jgi:hypothetical protein